MNREARRMRRMVFAALLLAFSAPVVATPAAAAEDPLPIRVVVVTAFETGADKGDQPGELQRWVEDFPLAEKLPFPASPFSLRYNPEKAVLAVVTGVGTARAATAITALGLDPRFDLKRSYWLVAGIAGANPDTTPIGAAVWAEWVVDGDLAQEIDGREIPPGWTTGTIPLRKTTPFAGPPDPKATGSVYHLDPGLVAWAYGLTGGIALAEPEALAAWRIRYGDHAGAREKPQVMRGDTLSASTSWHGRLMNAWATAWVDYWTKGKGVFSTAAMEDSGTLEALTALAALGKVDRDRVLVLRATSTFTMQYTGATAADSLAGEGRAYSALIPAIDAAYAVGSVVVNALVDQWDEVAERPPGR